MVVVVAVVEVAEQRMAQSRSLQPCYCSGWSSFAHTQAVAHKRVAAAHMQQQEAVVAVGGIDRTPVVPAAAVHSLVVLLPAAAARKQIVVHTLVAPVHTREPEPVHTLVVAAHTDHQQWQLVAMQMMVESQRLVAKHMNLKVGMHKNLPMKGEIAAVAEARLRNSCCRVVVLVGVGLVRYHQTTYPLSRLT